MNDVTVTVSGFAGNNPTLHMGKEQEWASFRVASTRRYMGENGEWTDGATLWFTVKVWRTAALNLARSVHKGDPVVVTGRLEVDEWIGPDGQPRMGLAINASAVGVDATRGRVEFTRVVHHDTVSDGAPGGSGGSGELVAANPGDEDPFAVDAPSDEDNQGDEAGSRPRELVNA